MSRFKIKSITLLILTSIFLFSFQNCGDFRLVGNKESSSSISPPPSTPIENGPPSAPKFDLYGDTNQNGFIDEAFEVGLHFDPAAQGVEYVCAPGSIPWLTNPHNNSPIRTSDGREGYFCYALSCAPDKKYVNNVHASCCSADFEVDVDGQCCLEPKSPDGECLGSPISDPSNGSLNRTHHFPWPQSSDEPAKLDEVLRLPVLRYSKPLKFAGRIVDSSGLSDSRWQMRTLRASQILPSINTNHLYFGLHGTVARYNLSTFFNQTLLTPLIGSSLNNKYDKNPAISEKYLPWNNYFYPDDGAVMNQTTGVTRSRHGWLLGWFEGTATIDMRIDTDERGYTYVTHEIASGWGITRGLPEDLSLNKSFKSFSQVYDTGERIHDPLMNLKSFKYRDRFYILGASPRSLSLYDVTDPSLPVQKWKKDFAGRIRIDLPKIAVIDNVVKFAFVNNINHKIEFYGFENLQTGPPDYSLDFIEPSSRVLLETDGHRFFIFDGPLTQVSQLSNPIRSTEYKVADWNGSTFDVVTQRLNLSFAPLFLHYNDGFISLVGYRKGLAQSKPIPYLFHVDSKSGSLKSVQVPDYLNTIYYQDLDSQNSRLFSENYAQGSYVLPRDLSVVIYQNKQYIFVFNHGVGDVFEIENFSYAD